MKKKYRKLTDRQIICLFKYHHPKSLEEMQELGIRMRYFNKGLDRLCFRIGESMVLKFEDSYRSSYNQTPREIKNIKKIHTKPKYKNIRKHVITLLYGNPETRMMILPFIPIRVETEEELESVIMMFDEVGIETTDFHEDNFRRRSDGTLVCIDLGFGSS